MSTAIGSVARSNFIGELIGLIRKVWFDHVTTNDLSSFSPLHQLPLIFANDHLVARVAAQPSSKVITSYLDGTWKGVGYIIT